MVTLSEAMGHPWRTDDRQHESGSEEQGGAASDHNKQLRFSLLPGNIPAVCLPRTAAVTICAEPRYPGRERLIPFSKLFGIATAFSSSRVMRLDPEGSTLEAPASSTGGKSPSDHAIEAVAHIEHSARDARSRIDHFASTITRVAGTAQSIAFHLVWFIAWPLINLHVIPSIQPFDPFPFNLLTTVVSLEAIILTLFVLISQNRLSQEADKRAQLDLQVNLLAEKETTMILRMLHDISERLGVTGASTKELRDLLKETKVDELAEKLEKVLPSE
jgi:uncharacterized membrane protein